MIGYVYYIINETTGKRYVGITEDYHRRWTKHKSELRSNYHHSPKLQNAWNYYGEDDFTFVVKEVEISCYNDLYEIEKQEIKKYDSYNNGYNCNEGGQIYEWKTKVQNNDAIGFLCILNKYGDGYGKTFESCVGWAKGTASSLKRRIRYIDAICAFDKMSSEEKDKIAIEYFNKLNLEEKRLKRQLTQGGCLKAYSLTLDDFYFAFAAQDLGYNYSTVAHYFQIKPATVKDWFNGRSRVKERTKYNNLSTEEKNQYYGRVKIAELSGKPKV